jgi:hypothetical protein
VIVGIGVSVFIGAIAFITQFLIEVDLRISNVHTEVDERIGKVVTGLEKLEGSFADHVDDTRTLIKAEFAKINAATELFGLVEASALKTDGVTQLVKNATTISRGTPPLVFDFAQAEIGRLSGYLKELGRGGNVTYDGEDRDWLLGLTRVATVSLDATSLATVDAGNRSFVDGGLWTSDLGVHYLEGQREAIERRVEIRRIFIIDRRDLELDAEFTSILARHHAIGVKVRTLRVVGEPDDLTNTRRTSLFDFIVVDGVLSYETTIGSRTEIQRRPAIVTTTLVTNGDRVRERIRRYEDLWAAATDFAPKRT